MQGKELSGERKRPQVRSPNKIKHRANLIKQFQQFKERIQSFQDKNQSIINRIRDAYSFKRKNVPNLQPYAHNGSLGKQYDAGNDYINQSAMLDANEAQDVNLNRISSEGMLRPTPMEVQRSKTNNLINSLIYDNLLQVPQKNMEARKSQSPSMGSNGHFQRKPSKEAKCNVLEPDLRKLRTEKKLKSYVEQPYNHNENTQLHLVRSLGVRKNSQAEPKSTFLEEKWSKAMMENRDLLKCLQNKEKELHRYKSIESKFKSYSKGIEQVVKAQLENVRMDFFQDVLAARIGEMQKYVKKCENKIKKLSLKVADVAEQRRTQQMIQNSRLKRMLERRLSLKMEISSSSDGKWRGQDNQSMDIPKQLQNPFKMISPRDFEAVIADYEEILKTPKKQNQQFERLLQEQASKRQQLEEQINSLSTALHSQRTLAEQLQKSRQGEQKRNERLTEQLNQLGSKLQLMQEELQRTQMAQIDANLHHQKLRKTQEQQFSARMHKLTVSHNHVTEELKRRLAECETACLSKASELKQLKEHLTEAERKCMQKDCELFGVNNKLKKIENDCTMKESKLKQLQALLLKQSDSFLFEKSVDEDSKMANSEFTDLQERLRSLTLELEEKNLQIDRLYIYKRESEEIQSTKQRGISHLYETNKRLSEQVELLTRQLRKTNQDQSAHTSKQQMDMKSWLEGEQDRLGLEKMQQTNSQLLQELQRLKQENASNCRELIRLNCECTLSKNEVHNWEAKFDRLREEKNDLKKKAREMEIAIEENSKHHLSQIERYILENNELKKTIQDLQSRSQERDCPTLASSIKYEALGRQFRFWEKEKPIELKESMEAIQGQSQKDSHEDIITYQDKLRLVEAELQKGKQREQQLSAIMHQLFENTQSMEEENKKLTREVGEKQKLVQELRDLIELKEAERETRDREGERELQRRNSQIKETTHISFKLSADYSDEINEFMELSCLSNISDIFKRDDVLEDKIKNGKTSREEQVMLYSKTSAYIKSLKNTIDAKERRIKSLEKQLLSVKSQNSSVREPSHCDPGDSNRAEVFLQDHSDERQSIDSIQMQMRSAGDNLVIKELQNDKNLMKEENKMLTKQIEVLRTELRNAEEQENSLMKIKDLYKEEIKRLIEKHDRASKQLEGQIKRLEGRLEQSESYHNLEAVKQLFLKVVGVLAYFYDSTAKSARKEEKRKELEEYLNVMCSLLLIEASSKDKLLASLRK